MKKCLIRLTALVGAIMLAFVALSVSAATGVYDDTAEFPCISGDVNDDGDIDIRDLVRLKKYIGNTDVEIFEAASDLNGDGKYDAADLVELRKVLFKL